MLLKDVIQNLSEIKAKKLFLFIIKLRKTRLSMRQGGVDLSYKNIYHGTSLTRKGH